MTSNEEPPSQQSANSSSNLLDRHMHGHWRCGFVIWERQWNLWRGIPWWHAMMQNENPKPAAVISGCDIKISVACEIPSWTFQGSWPTTLLKHESGWVLPLFILQMLQSSKSTVVLLLPCPNLSLIEAAALNLVCSELRQNGVLYALKLALHCWVCGRLLIFVWEKGTQLRNIREIFWNKYL
jgi:hypothetical protein